MGTEGPLNFYLAARYSRREELCGYRSDLETRGHVAPARWLLGEHQAHGLEAARAVETDGPVPAEQARLFAADDMEDLIASDVLVAFTEPPRSPLATRGGRHVEMGVALGLRHLGVQRRRIFIVGPIENVFYALPDVDGRFDDWAGFLAHLDRHGHEWERGVGEPAPLLEGAKDISAEIVAWMEANFGAGGLGVRSPTLGALSLAEEVGEVMRAVCKDAQGIRGTHGEWMAELEKEMGDVYINLVNLADLCGIDLAKAVRARWATIRQRNWVKDRVGHGLPS